jgi:hypothetical protein
LKEQDPIGFDERIRSPFVGESGWWFRIVGGQGVWHA